MEKINLYIEKGEGVLFGRVNYDDNLIVAEAPDLILLKDKMKSLLKEFHDVKPEKVELITVEETSTETFYEVADHKFKVKYFFDVEGQFEGASVYLEKEHHGKEKDEFIGEVVGLEIPMPSDDPENTDYYKEARKEFERDLLEWLDNNFF
jgi:hypothetical protein